MLFGWSLLFFYCSGDHRDLHSFPTRRSSDLRWSGGKSPARLGVQWNLADSIGISDEHLRRAALWNQPDSTELRSEEHTSELQSLTNLVCRLLLEKKNTHTDYARLTQATNAFT